MQQNPTASVKSDPSVKSCIECGTPTMGSVGAAGLVWKSLCQACKDKADNALAASVRGQAQATALLIAKFDEIMNATQQPREMTTEEVADKLERTGLECEALEEVLGLAIDALHHRRRQAGKGSIPCEDFIRGAKAIRHVRTILLGRMADHAEAELCEALKERAFAEADRWEDQVDREAVETLREMAKPQAVKPNEFRASVTYLNEQLAKPGNGLLTPEEARHSSNAEIRREQMELERMEDALGGAA